MSLPALEDVQIPAKIKIASLWTSVMFCYIYGDYFELYTPGKLQSMLQGRIEPLGPVTQGAVRPILVDGSAQSHGLPIPRIAPRR